MKNSFVLFLVGCLLMLFSCKEDEFHSSDQNGQNSWVEKKMEKIPFAEFSIRHPDALSRFTEIRSHMDRTLDRNVQVLPGYFAETDEVVLINTGETVSYTFRLYTEEGEGEYPTLYNLVLSRPVEEETYSAYLVTYRLTQEEWDSILNHGPIERFTYPVEVANISGLLNPDDFFDTSKSIGCPPEITYVQTGGDVCPSGMHDLEEMEDGECYFVNNGTYTPSVTPQFTVLVDLDPCNTGGGGGGSYNPYDPFNPYEPFGPGAGGGDGDGSGNTGQNNHGGGIGETDDDPGDGSNGPQDPVITNPNTGGTYGPTLPCQALKDKLNEPIVNGTNFKMRLNSLKSKVYNHEGGREFGFINRNLVESGQGSDQNMYQETVSLNAGKAKNPLLARKETFGYAHTHPESDSIAGIPSDKDILVFAEMVNRRINEGLSVHNMYGIVVGNHGIYSLKVNDVGKFIAGYNSHNPSQRSSFGRRFKRKYEELITHGTDNTQTGNEIAILKFLREIESELGFGIYRANENLTNWNQLSLKSNATGVNSVPCN